MATTLALQGLVMVKIFPPDSGGLRV